MKKPVDEIYMREWLQFAPLLHRYMLHLPPPEAEFSLPITQAQALLMLTVAPSLTMTQLAQRLCMSRQQVTQVVKELERKGLAERKTSEENRRLVLVCLSEQGRALSDVVVHKNAERLAELFGEMTEEERRTVRGTLAIFRRVFQRVLENAEKSPTPKE